MTTADPIALLAAIVEATPDVPDANAEAGIVLEAGSKFFAERTPLVDALRAITEERPDAVSSSPEGRRLLDELRGRDARWQAALCSARHKIGQRLAAMRRRRQTRGAYSTPPPQE